MTLPSFRVLFAAVVLLVASSVTAPAQTPPRPGSLRMNVRDATGLPIAAAKVTITGADGVPTEKLTPESGIAEFTALPPGRYAIRVEAAGFDTLTLDSVEVRSGNRASRDVTLKIAAFVEDIDVVPADSDRQLADAFTTTLTDDQIAALPEDPDELAEVLAQLAGDGAEIRVDGFLDAELPPGTQIQSVVIRYDAASAGSSGGGPRIEIRTQPGGDRWRGNMSVRVRDEAFNARNAFAATRPEGQTRQYSWAVNGPLKKNKTGLSINVDRLAALDQRAIRAGTPSGIFSTQIGQPNDQLTVSTRLEHAITDAQRLRVEFRHTGSDASRQGLGEFDLPERAYTRTSDTSELRISHNATLRRQVVHDFRLQLGWSSNESTPESLATAVRIPGTLNFGGAQTQGGRDSRDLDLEDELMFTFRKRHQFYTGINISGTHYRGDEWRNAGGTFTFASLDDFNAGRPTTFTQRLGDPSFSYALYRYGAFIQDDFRVRKNLVLNFGIREELESHFGDWVNLAPRLGVNWTPSAKWKTALRAGLNINYQPLPSNVFEQTLLVNGRRQRDLVIANPTYPDPFGGDILAATPPGIIRAASDLTMPLNRRVNVGIDQPLGKIGRVRATYSRNVGQHLFRSVDQNAPIDGVRPDPDVRNITEVETTARSRNQSLEINSNINYPKYRLSANVTYTYGSQWNDSDGPLTLPPDSFHLENEWGPARQDIRHRLQWSANTNLAWGFRVNTNVRVQSAAPYTITSGLDPNGDGVNNERPDGVGRNSARGSGTRNVDLTLTWSRGVGERALPPPPRGRQNGPTPRPSPLVRFEFYVQANNALNQVNPQNYSGVLTSQFFGLPTSASAPRRISVGSRIYF